MRFSLADSALVGDAGFLPVPATDSITRKLTMLIEGECAGLGKLRRRPRTLPLPTPGLGSVGEPF